MNYDLIVIGAGPAGLLAAWHGASRGARVLLLEKNKHPGRKLLLTGSGRCNVTNNDPLDDFIGKFYENGRFLYPALTQFFRDDLLAMLRRQGLVCRPDAFGRFYPASQKAADVLAALVAACKTAGVFFKYSESALDIKTAGPANKRQDPGSGLKVSGVKCKSGSYFAPAVILACGGASYPKTGSSGDGFALAAKLGHNIIQPRPGLVALDCKESWVSRLSGISLPDVALALTCARRPVASSRGSLLFTHHGVSGPPVLGLSRYYDPARSDQDWQLDLDLLPGLSQAQVFAQLLQICPGQPKASLQNCVADAAKLPRRLAGAILAQAGLDPGISAGQAGKRQLGLLTALIHSLPLTISGTRGLGQAMVTAGGIDLNQIDPRTMMSRLVSGLYAAGEVLDIDGDTGGYNLQAAFSTGWLAAQSATRQEIF
jgi:predicted Rossmann fold flavoprotein